MTNIKAINILMVEDNIDHAELMIDAIKEFNVHNHVQHVINGEQAVDYLLKKPPFDDPLKYIWPDVIFLDIRMPRQDGIETLTIIKNNESLKHLPVVMISTSKTPPEIEACYRLGASGYITKPLEFHEFSQKMKELNYYWVLCELPSNTL